MNNSDRESIKYTRRDFLLLGTGTAFIGLGGFLNQNFISFANVPFQASATTSSTSNNSNNESLLVDNILLTTEPGNTVRASASANSPSSNYYKVTKSPQNGQLSWAGRTMAYTPNIGFTGTDFFTYRAENNGIYSNEAIVSINIRENIPFVPYKYNIIQKHNQKTRYTSYDSRDYFSDRTRERRFQAIIESYDRPFINQEVTAVLTMKGVSDTDRIELATRIGYPSNQYQDQRSGYVFYLRNNGDQSKRFMILNNNNYEDHSELVTPKFSLGKSLANKTFGMKAVTYVIPGTKNVKLEFYLDLENSGNFRLYFDLIDSGQIPNALFVNPPGSTAKIRCDKITDTPTLNYFEIAEIDPQNPMIHTET